MLPVLKKYTWLIVLKKFMVKQLTKIKITVFFPQTLQRASSVELELKMADEVKLKIFKSDIN